MCLKNRLSDEADFIDNLPDTITVYKMVVLGIHREKGLVFPSFSLCHGVWSAYKFGLNMLPQLKEKITIFFSTKNIIRSKYDAGFHFYYLKEDADYINENHLEGTRTIIECSIKKEWITTVGIEHSLGKNRTVIITNKFVLQEIDEKI